LQVNGRAEFESEADAKDGEVVGRMGLYLLRELFPRMLETEGGLSTRSPGIAAMVKQYKDAIRAVEVARADKTITAAGKAKLDFAPLFKHIADELPAQTDANNLKQIGLALHNHHDAMGHVPAAICDRDGKPLLSWRVAILPYIEQEALYRQFRLNEPWDSPHNKKLLGKMPKIYASPTGTAEEPDATFYQMPTGPKTLFPRPDHKMQIFRIPDGTSNTFLVVEASKGVPWTKPQDVAIPAMGKLPKLGGQFPTYFNALFADGSVRRIKRDADEELLRRAIDPADGNVIDFGKLKP
jgi:prepilin-type processing-associated H-X9-DG protein